MSLALKILGGRIPVRGVAIRMTPITGRLIMLFLFIWLPATTAAPAPKEKVPQRYFPTRIGAKWSYEITSSSGKEELKLVVSRVETIDGDTIVSVDLVPVANTPQVAYKRLKVTNGGLFQLSIEGRELDPPPCRLRLPHTPHNKWDYSFPGYPRFLLRGGKETRMQCVSTGPEAIEVPAGTYQAVRVESIGRYGHSPVQFRMSEWYAPGIGLVKHVDQDYKTVLKSFSLGEDK